MNVNSALGYNAVLCRYGEIGLKGGNRRDFEQRLTRNLEQHFRDVPGLLPGSERGRLFFTLAPGQHLGPDEVAELRRAVPRVFGLSSASPAFITEPRVEAMKTLIRRVFPLVCQELCARIPATQPVRYAMRCRRQNPDFPMSCQELEIQTADELLPAFPRLQVDLRNPDVLLRAEVRRERAFISFEDIPGPGGLPTGTGGRVTMLLSGGIDSPVACYQILKRGCTADFVTFHSHPYTPPATVRKVGRLAELLNRFQLREGVLFAVNLRESQKLIRDACDERFRTVLYRRLMMRIASRIAGRRGAGALVTGENLGQVASQTLANLTVIADAADREVLRPVLANDKQETVALARRIGSFEISREQTPDSCTVFAPRHPVTAARLERVREEEKRLDLDTMVLEALRTAVAVDPQTLAEEPAELL